MLSDRDRFPLLCDHCPVEVLDEGVQKEGERKGKSECLMLGAQWCHHMVVESQHQLMPAGKNGEHDNYKLMVT